MKKALVRSLTIVSGVLLALGMLGVGPARAASNVGGLDLDGYCKSQGYASVTTVGSTAYDWRCVALGGAKVGISMTDACRAQHGHTAVDRVANFHRTDSWQCWATSGVSGGLDLDGYCKSQGYASVTTVGSTAYDWRCVALGGAKVGISMTDACRVQHGWAAIDRFSNFYRTDSWRCWI